MLTLSRFSLYFKFSTSCEFYARSLRQRLGSVITSKFPIRKRYLLMHPYKQRKTDQSMQNCENWRVSLRSIKHSTITPGTLQLYTSWTWIFSFTPQEKNYQWPWNRTFGQHQRSTRYTKEKHHSPLPGIEICQLHRLDYSKHNIGN